MKKDQKKQPEPTKVMLALLITLLFLDSILKGYNIILIDHTWSNYVLFAVAAACTFIYKIVTEKKKIENHKIRRTMNLFGILSILLFAFYVIKFLMHKTRFISNQILTEEGSLILILFFTTLSYAVYLVTAMKKPIHEQIK